VEKAVRTLFESKMKKIKEKEREKMSPKPIIRMFRDDL